MDYEMPICSGPLATIEIRKYLREKAPEMPQPYICCLTSYKNKQRELSATKAGMDTFLIKPIFVTTI